MSTRGRSDRVLLLTTDLEIGGTPTVVRELALRLNVAHPGAVEVACLAPWGPNATVLLDAGVRVTALHASGPKDLAVVGRLDRLIRSRRYDVVLSFLLHANAAAAAVAPLHRRVRFLQSLQTTQPWPRWHWALQRWAHRAAEAVVVPSTGIADAARRRSGIPASKLVVIPNAIDPADFAGELPRPATPGLIPIGFLGRLDRVKRVPDLLEAVHLLGDRVHLHVFGDGPERRTIAAKVIELGLRHRVTLHGPVARPQEALRQVALLVLPSEAEGFGLVLIEAMAAGVPVVATDIPGIRDVVRHEATGLLVPPRDPPALAAAVARLLDDAALRDRLAAAARADVAARFTWETILPRYAALLGLQSDSDARRSALSRTAPAPPPSAASSTSGAPTSTAPGPRG